MFFRLRVVDDLHVGALVDDLTFAAYRNNRIARPDISPERWQKAFGEKKGKALEARFLQWWRGEHPNQPEGPKPKPLTSTR